MTNQGITNNSKLRGEWAEMFFMTCAAEHGLRVSRPYGEMTHFDFVIGQRGCLLRVQVKSTQNLFRNGYACSTRRAQDYLYGPDDFDVLAVLVIPERVWYIIPAEAVLGKAKVFLRPGAPNSKYAPYLEAWHLLRRPYCPHRATICRVEACADDCPSTQ